MRIIYLVQISEKRLVFCYKLQFAFAYVILPITESNDSVTASVKMLYNNGEANKRKKVMGFTTKSIDSQAM